MTKPSQRILRSFTPFTAAFSPNRAKTSLTFEDYLPAGYAFDKEKRRQKMEIIPSAFDVAKELVTFDRQGSLASRGQSRPHQVLPAGGSETLR